jgi:hypothetical protein
MSSQQEALLRAFDAKTAYFVNNIAELSLETQASTYTCLIIKMLTFIAKFFGCFFIFEYLSVAFL